MNKHSVKFVRGSKTIWDQLNTTPEKIDNNTLYFIYEDENYSVGKLYLGQRLITDDKIINIKDIGDIQIDNESLINKQILIYNEENQEWKNSSLEEIIDLSNYYTKNEIDNNISTKMDLAPLNPTAEQIAALPDGQLYSDTANHKGVIKGGQEFYDTDYINTLLGEYYRNVFESEYLPPDTVVNGDLGLKTGDIWVYNPPRSSDNSRYRRAYILNNIEQTGIYGVDRSYTWEPTKYHYIYELSLPDQEERVGQYYTIGETTCFCYAKTKFSINDKLRINSNGVEKTYIVTDVHQTQTGNYRYLFNQFLTPDSLPIYDGTVI